MVYREACGLPVANRFNRLPDIPGQQQTELRHVYRNVRDIDLFVGALLESHAQGSQMGPTLPCPITRQFSASRHGDRFWYERNHESGFSLPQLDSIRNIRVAHKPIFTLRRLLTTNVKGKDKPEDRPGAVYKIHCSDCQATYIGETGRNLTTR